jgi:hypothetical protein
LTTIGSITEDRRFSDTEKVTRIRALLAQRETRRLLEKDAVAVRLSFCAASRWNTSPKYVIDGLMHNEVVKSDIHSTDAFGFSEMVFTPTRSSTRSIGR